MVHLLCKHCLHLRWTAGTKVWYAFPQLLDQEMMRSGRWFPGWRQCFEFLRWFNNVGRMTRTATNLWKTYPNYPQRLSSEAPIFSSSRNEGCLNKKWECVCVCVAVLQLTAWSRSKLMPESTTFRRTSLLLLWLPRKKNSWGTLMPPAEVERLQMVLLTTVNDFSQ